MDSREELEMFIFYHPENRAQLAGLEQEHHMHGSLLEKRCMWLLQEGGAGQEPERVRVHTHQGSKTHY